VCFLRAHHHPCKKRNVWLHTQGNSNPNNP
jgi:hypothetical protein